ncbi:hypothetical protein JCM24511_07922 [Saitozyma sp. JCM 24511]|nr:hypothetical protein JCM24511_07922 [Saitozyma sp. JCM 24511]
MRPLFFKSTWGFERSAFPDLFPKVAALGYDGVDIKIFPEDDAETLRGLKEVTRANGLQVVCAAKSWPVELVNFTQLPGNTMEAHLAYYRSNIVSAMQMEPLMINVQSGCDHWTEDECIEFYWKTLEIDCELGVVGKASF